jgi:hypothetical protein
MYLLPIATMARSCRPAEVNKSTDGALSSRPARLRRRVMKFSVGAIVVVSPATQVEQSVPELVQTGADGFKKVKYADLNIYILQGIRELKVANDNLVSETSALRAQLKAANDNQARLEERMEWLERKWSRPDMTGTK